jgi:uncharacterized coiled-coil protein SlyX
MGYFIKKDNGSLANIFLIQNVLLENNEVHFIMKNGQIYTELYEDEQTALARLNKISADLLAAGNGGNAELKKKIEELSSTIDEQATTIQSQSDTITEQNTMIEKQSEELESIANQLDLINGEVI